MYVESCTILVVVNRLSRPVVVLDGLPGLYGFKYDSATACELPLYLYSYKLVGSATLSIHSWSQVTAELLSTFQGYHPGTKTTRDLLNYIQRDDESSSDYLERLIQIKAQVPNAPEEAVIVAAVEGLAIG